jgi:hypothetical protein
MIIAGLETQDSAFFSVSSKDILLPPKGMSEDIVSFTFEEELGRYSTGTLVINDPTHYYSKVLRIGAKLDLSFGYLSPDLSKNASILAIKNPDQLDGGLSRTGVTVYITNPSGSAGPDGRITFNCNFYGYEMLDVKQHKVHSGMTKGILVSNLLSDMGVEMFYINFTQATEILNKNTQVMQRETNYKLLLRLAREWRCIFRISTSPSGGLTAIFISPQYIGQRQISTLMSGAIAGDSIYLDYKKGVANVIDYSWKNHQGSSGSGSNVRIITGPDGKPTFIRYVTKRDKVLAYEFKPERVAEKLKGTTDFTNRAALLKQYLNTRTFAEIEWAFDPIELSTAPQGLGYSMSVKMLGMPLMSAPLKVLFGEGFPDWFTPINPKTHLINYYARKVKHTIDSSGYKMDLDIVDGFTLIGGSIV